MADTTALKNRIRAAIKANDNQEITGPVLQQALLDIVDELNGATETEASQRQNADSTLSRMINSETQQRQSDINTEALERKKGDSRDIYFTNARVPGFNIANNTLTIVLPQNETMRLYNPYSGTEVEVDLSQQETTTFSLVTLRRLVYNFTQNTLSVEQTSAAHPQGNYVVLMSVFGSPENLGSIDGLLRGYYIAYMRSTLAGEVSRVENKSDKFNSLELVDVTGTDVKDTNMSLALRKNNGSEQDPDIVTLDTINISSASQEKAGLLPAINTWDSKPTYGNKKPISSEAISENIVNGFFSGKNNDYSYARFKSVIPNSRYIVIIDKDNISHQNVTVTGVFGFAVSSRDTNNVVTRLVNFQTTAYNNIPRYVIVTVPSDSICLEIGGRADVGTEVHFAILPYLAILQKHVYFTDAAVPVFTVSATTLNVVLPENKAMHIYGPDGLEKEVDLSQQQTLSFNIQTMQKLVYNYKTNNIGVVSITQNYEDGSIIDLLVVNGAVTGLLAGYYYNQLARAFETLSNLQNDIVATINGAIKNYDVSISVNSQQAVQYSFLKGRTYIIEKLVGCSSGFGSLYLSKDGTTNTSADNRIQTLDTASFVNNKLTFTAVDDALGLNGYWTAGSLKLKIYEESDGSMEDIRAKLLSECNVTIRMGYNTLGTRIPLAGCMSTDTMFAVPSGVTRIIWRCGSLYPDHNNACIIAYDSNRDRITSWYYTANSAERTLDLPEGCAYLNASFKVDANGAGVYQTDRTPIFIANSISGAYPQSIKNAERIFELNNTNGGIVYFTDAKWPSFVTDNRGLTVTFPEGENEYMRIYSNNGTVLEYNLNNLASREFTLASMQKLVYDWDNNTISVVRIGAIGNFSVLISLGGSAINHGAIDGALRGYYIAWLKIRLEALENKEEKPNPDEVAAIGNIQKWADFKFLFFSDVHGGWTNVQRVVDYAENLGASKCDCIINGGDTVLNRITDGLDLYNDIIEESNIPVLSVPGNHDCWTGSNWNWADQIDIYNLVTAEVASTVPTIVQPANAATEGLNYYYKDFGMVRVICLTAMQNGSDNLYFDTAQQNWLTDVLESARNRLYYFKATAYGIEDYTLQEGDTVSKVYTHFADMNADTRNMVTGNIYAVRTGVIIVTHAPFALSDRVEISAKLNSWCNSSINPTRSKGIAEDGLKVNEAALSIVDTYIENGGAFICWLTGHRHLDTVIKHGTYTGQFMINITTANANRHSDSYGTVDINDANYDAFDYIGIDMRSSMIKVLRVGLAQDSSMRIRRSWCYDYANKVLMSEN